MTASTHSWHAGTTTSTVADTLRRGWQHQQAGDLDLAEQLYRYVLARAAARQRLAPAGARRVSARPS